MSVERKCPSCGTWNLNQDFCTECKNVLSPVIIEENREKERELRRINAPTPAIDIFLDKWKNHRFWILRVLYKIMYTVSVIFVGIAAFFAYLAASPNG